MKRTILTTSFSVGAVWMSTIGGCNAIPLVAVPIPLSAGLGVFEVTANVPSTSRGQVNYTSDIELGRGNLELDPSAISFTPTAAGKLQLAAQGSTTTIVVSVWIADLDQEETVFDDGDDYGPYDVTFNADFSSVSIDPPTVSLTQRTVDLLNSGMFSIGIRIEADVDGTLTIESLTFNVGL